MQGAELLGILREATRTQHQELDSSPRLGRLARGSVDLSFYREVLARYRSCFGLLESLIDSAGERMVERGEAGWLSGVAPYRKRFPALESDLAHLAGEGRGSFVSGKLRALPDGPGVTDDSRPESVPYEVGSSLRDPMHRLVRNSPAEFELGVRYVLDGSSMGSRLICRHLFAQLGDMVRQAWHFWQVQALVGKDWPLIRNRLQSLSCGVDVSGQKIPLVTASANLCFQVFRDGFASEECN